MSVRELLEAAAAERCAGNYAAAAVLYKQVVLQDPRNAEVYLALGDLFRLLGNFSASERCYREVIAIDARSLPACNNIGNVLRERGRLPEAEAWYRRALDLQPESATVLTNLALCFAEQGNITEASSLYRRILASRPDLSAARSDYLMCLCYDTAMEPDALFEEHRRWGGAFPGEWTAVGAGANPWDEKRPLRIGYVSPDFRTHSVAYFVEPLLQQHDRRRFEVYAYSESACGDETTARLRSYPLVWRDTWGMSDEEAAEAVRRDRIDILVDLAGHTAGNRLGVFHRRPAAVQVTYCGYPNTTGLTAIDYRLTDVIADPPGEERRHTEQLIRLDRCFLCYRPPDEAPEVGPLPAGQDGPLTFGSFNCLPKINDAVVWLWARVLAAVPDSRLMLKNKAFADQSLRRAVRERLISAGAAPERLEMVGFAGTTRDHLAHYRRIDIGLDPFPYNGTTTTCEALWMGVPVVCLKGDRHAGRVGASLLDAVGLGELVADSETGYIEAACRLAADRARLSVLRVALRRRMRDSSLCDVEGFVRSVERAYLHMWERTR